MVKESIDRIKAAEEQAIFHIQDARMKAAEMQLHAEELVKLRIQEALVQAEQDLESYRKKETELASQQASDIANEAKESAESLELEYSKRMGKAVAYIVGKVTGEELVLSSPYEKSDHRST